VLLSIIGGGVSAGEDVRFKSINNPLRQQQLNMGTANRAFNDECVTTSSLFVQLCRNLVLVCCCAGHERHTFRHARYPVNSIFQLPISTISFPCLKLYTPIDTGVNRGKCQRSRNPTATFKSHIYNRDLTFSTLDFYPKSILTN
jgi:hypothetical protein